jgi:homocysteine S-methyltransferase
MARTAAEMVQAGCRIIGGCCGTTPEHIKALAGLKGAARQRVVAGGETVPAIRVRVTAGEGAEAAVETAREGSDLESKLGQEFIVCVEIDPPKGHNPQKALAGARQLKAAGVDAVNIADSPMARVRMSGQALGYLIRQELELEVILHLTTRDHSLLGLQAELLGAHAMGIRNILAVTGDPPSLGPVRSSGVFDIDSVGLVSIVKRMNSGTDSEGNPIGSPSSFLVGVGVDPAAEDLKGEIERLRRKVDAGARFAMTQPIYDLELWDRFLEEAGELTIPILFGVLPLESFRHAEFLHNEVPGITVPKILRQRLEKAGERAAEEGIEAARELIDKVAATTVGIYLMPSFGRYESVLHAAGSVLAKRPSLG